MTDREEIDKEETLVMPGEAARLLHVTTKTLQRMAERRDIESIKLPSGHRRYRRADVESLLGNGARS